MKNQSNDHLQEKVIAEKILAHPRFQQMSSQKGLFGVVFSIIVFVMYFAFIGVVGTSPELFATKVNPNGVTTWGIYIGMFVIIFSFLITAVYVYFANGKFEKITQDVVKEVMGDQV